MAHRCRVCGGELAVRWTAPVLDDRYEASYQECRGCGALQVVDPTWLAEAYADEAEAPASDCADTGRFRRNFSAYGYLAALARAGLIPERASILDFGGGYGLLTQMLIDAGYDAWTADTYVPRPFFAAHRVLPELGTVPERTFDVVTALEVFEHLTDPIDAGSRLLRVLRDDGLLVVSTELYDASRHDRDWGYLSRQAGQHVTFWSRGALRTFASRFGFRSLGFFPGDAGFLILFSHRDAGDLERRLAAAAACLSEPDFWRDATAPWDFRNGGVVAHLERPPVEAVGHPHGAWLARWRRR